MVATLIRLRFRLLVNQIGRSPWQIVATVLAGLYGLGILGGVVIGLALLSAAPIDLARTVIVLAGSALVLGWTMLPALTSGIDQTVDPAKLAPFPIPRDQLLLALAVSGVLGIPGIVTLVATLATGLTWWHTPLAAITAVLCAVIGTVTAVVGSRAVVAIASRFGTGRRAREAKALLIVIPLILLGPIIIGLSSLLRSIADLLPRIAEVLSWTPLGAIWAVSGDVAAGEWPRAGAHLLIGLATLLVLMLLWRWGLARALERPTQAAQAGAARGGIGWFGVFPGTPTGAVAARALTYWMRDPRYAQSLISIPLIPLLIFIYAGFGDNLGALVWVGPIVAVLLSMSISTDVSYDSTAFALHLKSGLRGVADRAGRVLALAVFAVPVTVLFVVGGVAVTGSWSMLTGLLGVSIGVLLTGFGVSSLVSGRFAVVVPAPGESPFKSKPGAGVGLMITTLVTWSVLGVLSVPELALAIIGFATGDPLWGWLALAVGAGLGTLFMVLGVRIGGRILDRHGPSMLVQLQRQR